jgi:signal transduction histidine kinase/HAMP domain-containing protein
MPGAGGVADIATMNANERRPGGRARLVRVLTNAWTRLTLWPRLAIGVTLGFVVLFAGFSILGIRAVDESTNRILQERLAITQMLARDFDGLLEHDFSDLAALGPDGVSSRLRRPLLAQIYEHGHGEFSTVALLDPSGRVLVSLGQDMPPPGATLAGTPYAAAAAATGKRAVSKPYRDARGRPVVALAVPIHAGGALTAVVVGTLDLTGPAVMQRLDAARRLGSTSHAELVGPGGIALASTEFDDVLEPGEHAAFYRTMLQAPKPGIADVTQTSQAATDDGTAANEKHVMAFARLGAAPWGVALGGTDSETFAPARRLRRTLMLAGTTSLAALWLLTLLGARFLVRPVRVLTRAAEEMASGDLERPVSVVEGGEIGVLGESLETMRAQLKDSLETVRRWGEELEVKVAERTGELNARNRQLAAVGAVMAAANESHELEEMLQRCLDVVLEQTEADAAAVRLVDGGDGRPAPAVARGAWSDYPCRSCSDDLCFRATSGGEPLYLDRPERERLHSGCAVAADALAILPLHGPNGVVGVLTVARRQGELPAPDERRVLAAICDQIAVAVENARLAAELRRLEARHEVQRLRSELISAVSHELRTPLGFIKSYATTLLREDTPIEPSTRRQFLEIIDEETVKLEHMIDELLDASRLQAGRLPIEPRPVRLGELLARAVDKARPTLADGRDVSVRLPDDDPLVLADEVRIEQVVDNLLENATRYSDPGSEIGVALAREDGHVLVSVTDRGDGIAEAELEQIFEPFYRGESSRQRRVRGAGLGLAISRGIVEAHGGRIWAESLQGRTTSFLLTLPLAERAA